MMKIDILAVAASAALAAAINFIWQLAAWRF